jgi:hypothetical protein
MRKVHLRFIWKMGRSWKERAIAHRYSRQRKNKESKHRNWRKHNVFRNGE